MKVKILKTFARESRLFRMGEAVDLAAAGASDEDIKHYIKWEMVEKAAEPKARAAKKD